MLQSVCLIPHPLSLRQMGGEQLEISLPRCLLPPSVFPWGGRKALSTAVPQTCLLGARRAPSRSGSQGQEYPSPQSMWPYGGRSESQRAGPTVVNYVPWQLEMCGPPNEDQSPKPCFLDTALVTGPMTAARADGFPRHPDQSISRSLFSMAMGSSAGSLLFAFVESHQELRLSVTRTGKKLTGMDCLHSGGCDMT